MVGSLVIVLLQIFCWFWQWKNFENRSIFDELKPYKKMVPFFWTTLYIATTSFNCDEVLCSLCRINPSYWRLYNDCCDIYTVDDISLYSVINRSVEICSRTQICRWCSSVVVRLTWSSAAEWMRVNPKAQRVQCLQATMTEVSSSQRILENILNFQVKLFYVSLLRKICGQ